MIARSFAFIYGRNQPSLGLLGVTISDEEFYKLAQEGEDITLNIPSRTVTVGNAGDAEGKGKSFPFTLSEMEYSLTVNNGVAESYRRFGKGIWERFTGERKEERERDVQKEIVRAAVEGGGERGATDKKIEW